MRTSESRRSPEAGRYDGQYAPVRARHRELAGSPGSLSGQASPSEAEGVGRVGPDLGHVENFAAKRSSKTASPTTDRYALGSTQYYGLKALLPEFRLPFGFAAAPPRPRTTDPVSPPQGTSESTGGSTSPLESQSPTQRSAAAKESWMRGDYGPRAVRRSGNVSPGTPPGCRTPQGSGKKARETETPFGPEDNSLDWFRIWVLCSVACIVLLIPFGLTLLSYHAASKFHKVTTHRGQKSSTPGRHPAAAINPERGPLIYYDDRSGRPLNCQSPNYSDVKELVLDAPVTLSTGPPRSQDKMYRRVFCVFDTLNLTDGWKNYWDIFPFEHCTDIIVYSMYLDSGGKLRMKRSTIIGGHLDHPFSMTNPYHRGIKSNVYITYGGSRADSPAIGKVVHDRQAAVRIVGEVHGLLRNSNYRGLNLDWDHPKDACQQEQKYVLARFLLRFRQVTHLLLTVPPDVDILKQLRLPSLGRVHSLRRRIEYVIVATHRLRAQGRMCCTGGLNEASMVFWAIRKMRWPWLHHRLAYSIALGADTYFSNLKELWTPGVPLSRFYDPAQGTMKMSYKEVCKLPTVSKTDECVLSIASRNGSGYKMAAFAGREQLRNRLVKSNYYQMARSAVVIYDIELDDYEGVCENIKWPLTRAFSEPFNESLRHP